MEPASLKTVKRRFFSIILAFFATLTFCVLSCQNVTTVPDHGSSSSARTIEGPAGLRATSGLKGKITLTWAAADEAARYFIYGASSPSDAFSQIGESKTNSYSDPVSAGRTFYYKICAVDAEGNLSEFSPVAKGTSLAAPIISAVNAQGSSATVFWYMENSASYADRLCFDVFCASEDGKELYSERLDGGADRHTFDGLNKAQKYLYYVQAFLEGTPSERESSEQVNEQTANNYNPQSPEFSASQGESIDGITLTVTLPPKVRVSTVTKKSEGKKEEVEYPLYFYVERKLSSEEEKDYKVIIDHLYYDGSSAPPASYAKYKEGNQIQWTDVTVSRGVQYDYRIKSYIETSYSEVIGSEFANNIGSRKSTTSVGWAASRAVFAIKDFTRIKNPKRTAFNASSLSFKASWDDLGKAENYSFAIQQNRRSLVTDNNGAEDPVGKNTWLLNEEGSTLFDSLEQINELTCRFNLEDASTVASVRGTYSYTLYLIPRGAESAQEAVKDGKYLDAVRANGTCLVSDSISLPDAVLSAQSGWKDRVVLSYSVQEGVDYSFERLQKDSSGTEIIREEIPKETVLGAAESYSGTFVDSSVKGGFLYSYILKAVGSSGEYNLSSAEDALVLGTPAPAFAGPAYDSVTASWAAVTGADRYEIVLGDSGFFGNGKTFYLLNDGTLFGSTEGVRVIVDGGLIKVTIETPWGYNDARYSGKKAELRVLAQSVENSIVKDTAESVVDVWTMGPAQTHVTGTNLATISADSISITWNEVPGAAGYAVYRTRPSYSPKTQDSVDVYYVASGAGLLLQNGRESAPGEAFPVMAGFKDGVYTLTDSFYYENGTTLGWYENQACIAMGIPFKYKVFPLLGEDDASFTERGLPAIGSGQIEYSHMDDSGAQALGFTHGYGMELTATKADWTSAIGLAWKIPESERVSRRTPVIFYRKKGSDQAWTMCPKTVSDSGVASISLGMEDLPDYDGLAALEFAVSYNSGTRLLGTGPDGAYVRYLNSQKDDSAPSETTNVGYMWTLPGLYAPLQTNDTESYTENVDIPLYGGRAVGLAWGEKYTLFVKNLNCSAEWLPLCTFDKTGRLLQKNLDDWHNVSINSTVSDGVLHVQITPNDQGFDTQKNVGTHTGILKVLRDYKHYYRVEAVRTNNVGKKVTAYYGGEPLDVDKKGADAPVYTFRKITNDEFAKAVALVVCDAMNQAGLDGTASGSKNRDRTVEGASGSFHIEHVALSNASYWGTLLREGSDVVDGGAYTHVFLSGLPGSKANPFQSAFSLSIKNRRTGNSLDQSRLFYLATEGRGFSVSHETGLSSYQAKNVGFACGSTDANAKAVWNYSFEKDGKTVVSVKDDGDDSKNDDEIKFYEWFPFNMGADRNFPECYQTNSLVEYTGDWWKERE